MQHSCYVCHGEIDLEKLENNKGPREEHWSYVCHKKMKNNDIQYRHLWHGVLVLLGQSVVSIVSDLLDML